ncbi:unnamed protein product, partial [Absidia cylindrospora]
MYNSSNNSPVDSSRAPWKAVQEDLMTRFRTLKEGPTKEDNVDDLLLQTCGNMDFRKIIKQQRQGKRLHNFQTLILVAFINGDDDMVSRREMKKVLCLVKLIVKINSMARAAGAEDIILPALDYPCKYSSRKRNNIPSIETTEAATSDPGQGSCEIILSSTYLCCILHMNHVRTNQLYGQLKEHIDQKFREQQRSNRLTEVRRVANTNTIRRPRDGKGNLDDMKAIIREELVADSLVLVPTLPSSTFVDRKVNATYYLLSVWSKMLMMGHFATNPVCTWKEISTDDQNALMKEMESRAAHYGVFINRALDDWIADFFLKKSLDVIKKETDTEKKQQQQEQETQATTTPPSPTTTTAAATATESTGTQDLPSGVAWQEMYRMVMAQQQHVSTGVGPSPLLGVGPALSLSTMVQNNTSNRNGHNNDDESM